MTASEQSDASDEFEEELDSCLDGIEPVSINLQGSPLLRIMYTQEELHDVILLVEERELSANKAYLASASTVFRAMFTSGFKESRETGAIKRIHLSQIKASTMKRLLDILYIGTATVSEARALLLLQAAHMYQMDLVLNRIAAALGERISFTNYMVMWGDSLLYDVVPLQKSVAAFCRKHLDTMRNSSDFYALPSQLMSLVMQSLASDMKCKEIADLFADLQRWASLGKDRPKAIDNILKDSIGTLQCCNTAFYNNDESKPCKIERIGNILIDFAEHSERARCFSGKILGFCAKKRDGVLRCNGLVLS